MQRTVKLLLLLSALPTLALALPACGSDDSANADDAAAPGPDGTTPGHDSGPPSSDGSTPGDDDGSVTPGNDGGPGNDGSAPSNGDDVLTYHKNVTRDGVYVDALMTKDNAKKLKVDPTFNAPIDGWLLAQPLYVANGAGGKATIYAASDSNNVYALDATTGAVLWKKTVAPPLTNTKPALHGCGNIDPLGVTGTPVIDLASRSIFLDAMTTGPKHLIFALSLDDGSTKTGWPVDTSKLSTTAGGQTVAFDASVQSERGALTVVGGTLYVPYGGHIGDCGDYHGWVVGVPVGDPSKPKAWATDSVQAGIWAPNGIASDGTSIFVATGNAHTNYPGPAHLFEESLIRLGAGPTFSKATTDYFAPSNWLALDHGDTDISGTGPMVLDLPGNTPSALLVGLGKNGVMYLQDRANLGGIGKGNGSDNEGLASKKVSNSAIINGSVTYKTAQGTYVAFKGSGNGCPAGQSGDLTSVKITPGSPPTMNVAWCAKQNGNGSPMVTTTDGTNDVIVWGLAASGSSAVTGFDGDTGAVVVPAITTNATTHEFETTTAVHGRIIVGGEGSVIVLSPQ